MDNNLLLRMGNRDHQTTEKNTVTSIHPMRYSSSLF